MGNANHEGQAPVRCPAAGCATVFEIDAGRLGRSMHCPTCGVRMTARPLGIEARLEAQQAQIRGAPGLVIPRLPLCVVLDDVRSLWNVGSIFRTADACGVREILLCGITGCPPRVQIAKTALGAEQAVAWRYLAHAGEALKQSVAAGYTAVAVETSPGAVIFEEFEWPSRVCLVIGNEVAGVTPSVLGACEHHVSIPMRGVKDSLNVAVAFGIVVHHVSRVMERAARGGSREVNA